MSSSATLIRTDRTAAPSAIRRPATPTRTGSGFRTDIQGLRALAVSLVLIYHLMPDRLSGGFVGVDVFFVISGFLITSHLYADSSRSPAYRASVPSPTRYTCGTGR